MIAEYSNAESVKNGIAGSFVLDEIMHEWDKNMLCGNLVQQGRHVAPYNFYVRTCKHSNTLKNFYLQLLLNY